MGKLLLVPVNAHGEIAAGAGECTWIKVAGQRK